MENNMSNSFYKKNDIKNKIDIAIQLSMYYADKSSWDALLEVQARLYEQFGIDN